VQHQPTCAVAGQARSNGRASDERARATTAFLEGELASGALTVANLEARAREAGLLGKLQNITNAKIFKSAKLKLGIRSRREGFGRGGEWVWEMPPTPKTAMVETAVDNAPTVPVSVIYAEVHSRPDNVPTAPLAVAYGEGPRPDSVPEVPSGGAYDEGQNRQVTPHTHDRVKGDLVPQEWVIGVARLDLTRAPRDVPPHRWRLFVGDCQAFVTSSQRWAPRAAEIGWSAMSLFGCSSVRPLDHFGSAGLLWNVAGGKLIRLHKDWAVIAGADGSERVFHRRPTAANGTLPWRLR